MAAQLLAEGAGDEASILVLGAGGGLEIKLFSELYPRWRFTGVDPAPEMLKQAKRLNVSAAERIRWIGGYVDDAPQGPFDGATCLLTLHFVPDDGSKLATLRAIRSRLKPGARFILVDHCLDRGAPDYQLRLERYAQFALNSGAPPEDVEMAKERLAAEVHMISPAREEQLLLEAGFAGVELFYAGLGWQGWCSHAPGGC